MKRVILIILDSVGIGKANDANTYFNGNIADIGANTLGHILNYVSNSDINLLPNLTSLGLAQLYKKLHGKPGKGLKPSKVQSLGSWGYAHPISKGKDTTCGHWEICGQVLKEPFDVFEKHENSIPKFILEGISEKLHLNGFIGNCIASGTEIINNLGNSHIITNKPIVYTSADSVIQFACNEDTYGLENLYLLCKVCRNLIDNISNLKIGRIIARPFTGTSPESFIRTKNRKDYSLTPDSSNLLANIDNCGGKTIAIGKIKDIFADKHIHSHMKSSNNNEVFNEIILSIKANNINPTLIFANLNDFDSLYGHRRDVQGYFNALADFDIKVTKIVSLLKKDDICIITADHGNDPTWCGTDHTREQVPILVFGNTEIGKFLGERKSLADIGQSVADYLNVSKLENGESFL